MRAFDPEVVDAVWEAVKGRLPDREDTHPLGCHNPRIPDRVCFERSPDPVGDRLFLGDHRTAVRWSRVGHHPTRPAGRMDRGRGVRRASHRSDRGL